MDDLSDYQRVANYPLFLVELPQARPERLWEWWIFTCNSNEIYDDEPLTCRGNLVSDKPKDVWPAIFCYQLFITILHTSGGFDYQPEVQPPCSPHLKIRYHEVERVAEIQTQCNHKVGLDLQWMDALTITSDFVLSFLQVHALICCIKPPSLIFVDWIHWIYVPIFFCLGQSMVDGSWSSIGIRTIGVYKSPWKDWSPFPDTGGGVRHASCTYPLVN